VNAMKLFSVGAHCYPICHLPWTDYTQHEGVDDPPSYETTLYGERVRLTPLPIAIPATISYLGIAEALKKGNGLAVIGNNLGDTEWNRVSGLIGNDLSKVHTIGSLEGVWEGAFTVRSSPPSVRFANGVRCLTLDSTRISRPTMPSFKGRVQTSQFKHNSCVIVKLSKHGNTSCLSLLPSAWERL